MLNNQSKRPLIFTYWDNLHPKNYIILNDSYIHYFCNPLCWKLFKVPSDLFIDKDLIDLSVASDGFFQNGRPFRFKIYYITESHDVL